MIKAVRFWLEFAKRVLTAWDETGKEMGFTPFERKTPAKKAKPKVDAN